VWYQLQERWHKARKGLFMLLSVWVFWINLRVFYYLEMGFQAEHAAVMEFAGQRLARQGKNWTTCNTWWNTIQQRHEWTTVL
jgi:hypothetical protein